MVIRPVSLLCALDRLPWLGKDIPHIGTNRMGQI